MKYIVFSLLFLFSICELKAQDSDFVRAQKTLDQIENGFKYLKRNDTAAYNNLSAKLSDCRTLLESTKSKTHKDYNSLVNRWNAAKDKLIAIAAEWQKPQYVKPEAAAPQQSSSQIYNAMIQKYQTQNRPKLSPVATPKQAAEWVLAMQNLVGPQLVKDTQQMEAYFASGKVTKQDKERFDRWTQQTWYNQIVDQIKIASENAESELGNSLDRANFINNADENDKNKVMNIGGSNYYQDNKETLEAGLFHIDVVSEFDKGLNQYDPQKRNQQKELLKAAKDKLERFKIKDAIVRQELASMPKKPKSKSTSQKLWLDGSQFCEITQKGEVWINSKYVGYIEGDGEIWVNGNSVGSIEKNGDVWHRGNQVGTLTASGEVWKSGSRAGSITEGGKVWIGSSSRGTVEGPGDWRRAAIVYFFSFYSK
ncbi:MAG: hypothetical protein KDF60_11645 [Calditrichaeota bacterium]|nr:hypothetical protein [Calditrichota bacterium]